jgi:FAD/FMN-containing dehydrogenase
VVDTAATARPIEVPASLESSFRGELLRPGEAHYDEARAIWNGSIDRHPGLIARCAGVADVAAALAFAVEREVPIAVRSGGHGVGGLALCEDGIVIDLSAMKGIRVDPAGRRVRAEAGVLLGELDREGQHFGMAVPSGIVTHTGIAGLTLGGGIGWVMRKHGLTVDNLISVDVVTADGRFLVASQDENPDLFWGIRGAGANFGVVTSFEYRLHEVGPTVLAGPMFFPLERGEEVLRFYRDWIAEAPDELTTVLNLRRAPAVPFLPEDMHGKHVVTVACCWIGSPEEGERVLAPLRELAPSIDLAQPKPFLMHQAMFDPTVPHGWQYYWKSHEFETLTDEVIDVLVQHTWAIASPLSYSVVFHQGGAVARVAEDAMAYSHRGAGHAININGVWIEGSGDEQVAWTRGMFGALEPFALGVYVNFLGAEGDERVRAAYGDAKYERLAQLKAQYDPTNVFRLNQNVKPAASGAAS